MAVTLAPRSSLTPLTVTRDRVVTGPSWTAKWSTPRSPSTTGNSGMRTASRNPAST